MIRRTLAIILLLLIIIGGIGTYWIYQTAFGIKTTAFSNENVLYIYTGDELKDVLTKLEDQKIVKHPGRFAWLAKKMKYGSASYVKPGKYHVAPGSSYKDIITLLRLGSQTPVKLTIPVTRRLEKVASIAGSKLEADSLGIMDQFKDWEKDEGHIIQPFLSKVVPNTYELLWNTSAAELTARLLKEYEVFWDQNNRREKAKALGLTPDEIYTLASIVERETNHKPERPTIAGVYLNRLHRGIALQADPSVVFALNDYTIRRVLNKYLTIDSPYNTYKYSGLPPGPIGLASPNSIDAVLDAETHDYLFFCAEPDNKGSHAFATNLKQHNRNAKKFRSWLDSQGIHR